MADLVRIKEKFQVTLPVGARRQIPVREGDYLEVVATAEGGFLLTPQRVEQATKTTQSMVEFLRRNRATSRSSEEIDTALNADRNSWER
jgi:AbrB family looped-hinge helix DNA binding protein